MTPPKLTSAGSGGTRSAAGVSRGRPKKTTAEFAKEVELVNELALALKQGRTRRIEGLGFNEGTALRFVMKRRRGPLRTLISTDAVDLVAPATNKTARALQLIVEHGCRVNVAASALGIDVRNLRKKLPAARRQARLEKDRQVELAKKFTIEVAKADGTA